MTQVTDCEKIVEEALVGLLLDFPIYAQLITRIGVEIVENKDKPYLAWTDGRAITVNKYAVERNNRYPIRQLEDGTSVNVNVGHKEMMFILAHELMHLINMHFARLEEKGIRYDEAAFNKAIKQKLKYWNYATDYEINSLLHNNEEDGCRKPVGRMLDIFLYDSKYRNKTAEEIYDEIMQEQQNQNNQQQNTSGGSGNGSGSGSGSGESDSNEDDDGNSSFTDEEPSGIDFELDDHIPLADDTTKNELIAKIGDVIGNSDHGTGSSALDRAIKKAFAPEPFNWRKALQKYIRGWMKDNYTWNKPSRAGIANKIILPSQGVTPKMHVAVAIDTSGSVGENELNTLLNHLFTILQVYKDFQVDVWCVSTHVHEDTFMTFTAQNKSKLKDYQIKSDGGTNLRTCFDFIEEKYKIKKPDTFILMSDFYDSLDGDTETRVNYPCIWFVIDHEDFRPPKQIKAATYFVTIRNGKM